MCRAAVIHNIDDVYEGCNGPLLLLNRQPARLLLPGPKSDWRGPCSSTVPPSPHAHASETYEILMRRRPIRNRKLTRASARSRSSKETIMLDVAFVALGCAVLALMGLYALTLRQL